MCQKGRSQSVPDSIQFPTILLVSLAHMYVNSINSTNYVNSAPNACKMSQKHRLGRRPEVRLLVRVLLSQSTKTSNFSRRYAPDLKRDCCSFLGGWRENRPCIFVAGGQDFCPLACEMRPQSFPKEMKGPHFRAPRKQAACFRRVPPFI